MIRARSVWLLFLAVGWLAAACSSSGGTTVRNVPIRLLPLVPDARSRISRVDWQVVTADNAYSGTVAITSSGSPIDFTFPGASPLISVQLKGYDSANRLRAGGVVQGTALALASLSAPATLRFALYDEFQAYLQSYGAPLTGPFAFVDSANRPVFLGGSDTVQDRDEVDAFHPETGQIEVLGHLKTRRNNFGATRLVNGKVLIAGGDAPGTGTMELWDPLSESSAGPTAMFAGRRKPFVFQYSFPSVRAFVIGGTGSQSATFPAEVLSSSGTSTGVTVTLFDDRDGDVYTGGLGLVTPPPVFYTAFFRWGGLGSVSSYSGTVYRENTANSIGTFAIPKQLVAPAVVYLGPDTGTAKTLLVGSRYGSTGDCSALGVIPRLATTGSGQFLSMSPPRCDPAVLSLGVTRALIVGGVDSAGAFTPSVKIFDTQTSAFYDQLTPDGRPQALVVPRAGARVVQTTDGSIVVIGGYGATAALPRFEVSVPSPPP